MATEEQQPSITGLPESEFQAGEYLYQVNAEPARMKDWMVFVLAVPALAVAIIIGWLSSSFGVGIGAFIGAWAGGYWLLERVLTKVDARWKVTTSRRRDDEESLLETLNVEILTSEEQAQRRRSEVVNALLKNATPEQVAKLSDKTDKQAKVSTRAGLIMMSPLLISLGGMALALSAPDQPDGSIPPRAELGMVVVIAGLVLFFAFGVVITRRAKKERNPHAEAVPDFENDDPRLRVRASEEVVSAPVPAPSTPERPKDPDRRFRDGNEWASVSVQDVWSPARRCVGGKPKADKGKDGNGSLLGTVLAPLMLVGLLLMFLGLVVLVLLAVIFVGPVYLILKRIDGRHKVTVHRTDSSGRFRRWRVLKVEFYKTEEEAKVRREEILKNWSTDYWASMPPLSRADRRRLRKESR